MLTSDRCLSSNHAIGERVNQQDFPSHRPAIHEDTAGFNLAKLNPPWNRICRLAGRAGVSRSPASTDVLPNIAGAVVAVAIVPGEVKLLVSLFWQTWWFRLSGGLACLFALLAFHHLRLRQLTQQLNARFDERLIDNRF